MIPFGLFVEMEGCVGLFGEITRVGSGKQEYRGSKLALVPDAGPEITVGMHVISVLLDLAGYYLSIGDFLFSLDKMVRLFSIFF